MGQYLVATCLISFQPIKSYFLIFLKVIHLLFYNKINVLNKALINSHTLAPINTVTLDALMMNFGKKTFTISP